MELSRFSGDSEVSVVVDLTLPQPKKPRKLTDYFAPAMTRPTRMPYFLQRYKPQEPVTKARDDGTGGGSNRESPAAISGPSTSHGNQRKRGAVNKTYTLAQKLEVLQYVRTHSEAEAARHFEIPQTTIRGWKGLDRQPIDRKKSLWRKGKNKAGAGRPISYSEDLEDELSQWILEMRDMNLPIQRQHVQRKAKALIQPHLPSFKASAGWLDKFLRRHSLSLRRQTSIQQKLPAQLEGKISTFLADVKALRMQHNFVDDLIINMDETPVCFDMASNSTIAKKGSREVIIRGTGAHKRRFTVTLTCTASGKMLQPFVTFKAKTQRILKKIPIKECNVIVTTQPKGWMDHKLMLTWIRKVLVQHTKGRHALLVFDTFKDHLTDDILAILAKNNISHAVIPGGCTRMIQPLDVCLNKPFKTYISGAWEEYMVGQVQSTQTASQI